MVDHLLTLIIVSPMIGVLILAFLPKQKAGLIQWVGVLATLLPLIFTFSLFSQFNFDTTELQFVENDQWISIPLQTEGASLDIGYQLGVDGLSMVMLLLTTIVATMAAFASMQIKKRWKEYFILFLLLEVGMLGVFAAQNLLLFFIFFEVTLVTTFLLIGIWGYFEKEKAAIQFLLYNGIGSAIMLIAFIMLFSQTGFISYPELAAFMEILPESPDNAAWMKGIFLALLVAFGIKLPIFPFHSWMLKVHVQAPPAVVMIHSGILLKMGAYGILRFNVGLFPEVAKELAGFIAILGLINILYGAFLAVIQTDLKRVMAFASISHMGIVLFGIAALNEAGIEGAIFQAISHGLISALLFLMIGVIYERTGTTDITQLGGLAKTAPFISGVFLAAAMASLGLPGMSGFISEFLAFLGLFQTMPIIAAIGALGIILAAVYLLRAVLRTTFGPLPETLAGTIDARPLEVVPMIILLAFILLIGIYPAVLSEPLQVTIQFIVSGIGG